MNNTTFTPDSILARRVIDSYYDRGLGAFGLDYVMSTINDYFNDSYYPRLGINNIDDLVDSIVDSICCDE
jgi:hypothetical protein